VAVLLGLPSSLQLLRFVLKDVVIHLALPYNQKLPEASSKLPEASSVSFDRFLCILLPIDGCRWEFYPPSWFSGGTLEVAPTTSGWCLASYASLLAAPFFVGSFQVQFALFSVRPWEDGLSFCPVKAAWLSTGKRTFASCAKRYLLQLDASSRLLDAAAFNRCVLRCLLSWHPGNFRLHRFGRRFRHSDPWRAFFDVFPRMDERLSW
jgi:hypothetical protein